MFALLALLCFVLALFGVPLGVNLMILGLAFIAAHLLIGDWRPWRRAP